MLTSSITGKAVVWGVNREPVSVSDLPENSGEYVLHLNHRMVAYSVERK